MERNNCVLIIAGPSGVGKTVVAEQMVSSDPRFTFLRSGTTRPRRGDAHDDEYLYYTEEEFLAAVERGEFAEHMRYGDNLYGTPRSELDRAFAEGKIPLLVLDLVGVESMARLEGYSACSVYVYADSETIISRLQGRYFSGEITDRDRANYDRRLAENKKDFGNLHEYYQHIFAFVKNDKTVEDCASRVARVFASYTAGADAPEEQNRCALELLSSYAK